jgi:hypothetical protein
VDEVEVDVEERRLARRLDDDMRLPDLLEQRLRQRPDRSPWRAAGSIGKVATGAGRRSSPLHIERG